MWCNNFVEKKNVVGFGIDYNKIIECVVFSSTYIYWNGNIGKSEESDLTDMSANMSADMLVNTPPTHYQRICRHHQHILYIIRLKSGQRIGRQLANCQQTVDRLSPDMLMGSDSLPLLKYIKLITTYSIPKITILMCPFAFKLEIILMASSDPLPIDIE